MASLRFLLFLGFLLGAVATQAQDLLTKQHQLPCLNKTFTIVAHIVADTTGTEPMSLDSIAAMVEVLNQDFAPICVGFEVCAIDTIDNYQYDNIERNEWEEMQVLYHQQRRINVFFVNSFQGQDTTYCGFATQNGIAQVENGGIMILKSCTTGISRSLSHQMGHYFGLLNTFYADTPTGNTELVVRSNCEDTGDMICDTAADPYVLGDDPNAYVNVGQNCRFIDQKQDAEGEFYVPDVGNIMSFYPEECKCGFTLGQYVRMATNCQNAAESMW